MSLEVGQKLIDPQVHRYSLREFQEVVEVVEITKVVSEHGLVIHFLFLLRASAIRRIDERSEKSEGDKRTRWE